LVWPPADDRSTHLSGVNFVGVAQAKGGSSGHSGGRNGGKGMSREEAADIAARPDLSSSGTGALNGFLHASGEALASAIVAAI